MKKEIQKLWLISLAVKFILAALIPLSPDEAYYWVWAQRLQLSYFDHPPAVAWLFYLGDLFYGLGHAVRWPAVFLGHLTLWIWILILQPKFDQPHVKTWIYLVLFSPLLGFGSLIITPDIPILFFWTLSIFFVLRALQSQKTSDYALLGLSLGLGFCSKYHVVLFIPCLLAYLTFEKIWTRVTVKGVLTTIGLGLLFSAPVLLWNFQNDFASFEFQLKHGLEKTQYQWDWTVTYILGQVLILFPLIFLAALKAYPAKPIRWALYFGWGPLLFFLLTSFRALVEANWPIIAYPSILALALLHPKIHTFSKITVGFFALLTTTVISAQFIPSIRNLNAKIQEPYVYQQLAQELKNYQPLYGNSYQMAASLWYFSGTPVFKLNEISRFDFFDTLPEARPQVAKFYLLKFENNSLPSWLNEQQWQVKELKRFPPEFVLLEISKL